MDVRDICSISAGISIRPLPEGASLPDSAELTGTQIQTLADMDWVLTSFGRYLEVHAQIRAILGTPGQPGSLRDHTWQIWGQVTQELVASTGVVADVLPIEQIAQQVIERLEAEQSTASAGDLLKLRQIVALVNEFLAPFRTELTSGSHPFAGTTAYVQDRSFKHNARVILEAMNNTLPRALREQINLAEINWMEISAATVERISGRLNGSIEAYCGVYDSAIPEPPPPVIIQPPVEPAPEPRLLEYGGMLIPAHGFRLAGDNETAPLPTGPMLYGQAAFGLNLTPEIALQLAYLGLIHLNGFERFESRGSRDSALFSFRWNDLLLQGGYHYEYNVTTDQRDHFGSLGAAYRLFDGLLIPFVGGMFGTGFGGFAGVSSAHYWEEPRIELSGQALYSLFYRNEELDHQVGGSVLAAWRPVSFGGADLRIGAAVGGGYDALAETPYLNAGLVFGWNSETLPLLPVRLGGF